MKICQSWLSTRKTKSLLFYRCPALPCSFVKSFLGLSLPVDFSYLRICRRIDDRAICLLFLSPCQKVEEPLENYYWRKTENIRMRYIQSYLSFLLLNESATGQSIKSVEDKRKTCMENIHSSKRRKNLSRLLIEHFCKMRRQFFFKLFKTPSTPLWIFGKNL